MRFPFPVMVGDIGGTNLRIARSWAPGEAPHYRIHVVGDTVALADVIERLRRELPRCAAAALAEGCGDRRCEDARGEDCSTCPSDCACGPGRECVTLPDRPARCNFSAVGLKD